MRSRKPSTEGFTLIELLIVIAIIGILAAVLIPNLLSARSRAYDVGAESCAKSIQTAEIIYQFDNQAYFPITKAKDNALGFGADSSGIPAHVAQNTHDAGKYYVDGINAACKAKQMVISADSNVTLSSSDYAFKISDTRGSRTFTITPNSFDNKIASVQQ